ncbi:hypothetical protein SteCoe_27980 [Stentor coeruleus]|uniref:Battenin n=1 Tax=Stentor coeruleus TaxID=5963 RepID=A0A1R2B984_9CILI|nr:hypothetical protein SteCoe_27980 [Stentor coeruleus]
MESFWKYFIALFSVGLINNFSYVLIGVGAQTISSHFGQKNLMPLFQFMLVSCNIPILILNFRYLVSVNTLLRITISSCTMLICFVIMSLCVSTEASWGFPISLIAALLMGMCQSLGECVNLGFIKAFPSDYLVGFTSGTGFAGIAGSGAWLICKIIGLKNFEVFLIFMPLIVIYWLSFLWIYKKGTTFDRIQQYSMVEGPVLDEESYRKSQSSVVTSENNAEMDMVSKTGNAFFSITLLKKVWKNMWWLGLNLGSVYFLEYCITTGFADRATLKYSGGGSFFKENAFEVIQFCYQIGVWCSRSSLKFFKVRRTWIVTLLQLINWVIWWFEAEFLFMTEWGEFILTVWVGCMGGLSYVNTGYLVLNSDFIPKDQKEASMNVSVCMNSLGILLATCFCLILDNFIMKN